MAENEQKLGRGYATAAKYPVEMRREWARRGNQVKQERKARLREIVLTGPAPDVLKQIADNADIPWTILETAVKQRDPKLLFQVWQDAVDRVYGKAPQTHRVQVLSGPRFTAEQLEEARQVVRRLKTAENKACAECRASIAKEAAYCSNCGYPQRPLLTPQSQVPS